MITAQVILSSIEAVKKFVCITNKYDFPIYMTTDKYRIDAKSIMGVFSLDLSKPVTILVEQGNPSDFLKEIEPFAPSAE